MGGSIDQVEKAIKAFAELHGVAKPLPRLEPSPPTI